jgi:hypothetical protein
MESVSEICSSTGRPTALRSIQETMFSVQSFHKDDDEAMFRMGMNYLVVVYLIYNNISD